MTPVRCSSSSPRAGGSPGAGGTVFVAQDARFRGHHETRARVSNVRLAPLPARERRCEHPIGFFIGPIVAQRRHDDTASVERVDIALRALIARAAAEADPMVGNVARIGSRLDMHTLEQTDTLPRQGQRTNLSRWKVRKVYIEAGRLTPADRQQLAHDTGAEGCGSPPSDIRAIGPRLAQRNRRNPQHHPGHCAPHGAGKHRLHAEIGAAIDAAEQKIGRRTNHQMTYADHRAVAGCSGYAVAACTTLGYSDRVMQADGVRHAALVVLGCHHPDLAGELARDLLQHREARRLDTVIVGQEDAIQQTAVPAWWLDRRMLRLFGFFRRPLELDDVAVRVRDVERGAVALGTIAPPDLSDGDAVPSQMG